MSFILNATGEEQLVKALGNHFVFKPKQIKQMDERLVKFLSMERRHQGLVQLSEKFEDPDYKASDEGKAELAEAERIGLDSFVEWLRQRVYNNQVSLRQDLEKSNLKIDPAALASAGEIDAMRLLAKYQKAKSDETQKRVDEVKELMKTVGPVSR